MVTSPAPFPSGFRPPPLTCHVAGAAQLKVRHFGQPKRGACVLIENDFPPSITLNRSPLILSPLPSVDTSGLHPHSSHTFTHKRTHSQGYSCVIESPLGSLVNIYPETCALGASQIRKFKELKYQQELAAQFICYEEPDHTEIVVVGHSVTEEEKILADIASDAAHHAIKEALFCLTLKDSNVHVAIFKPAPNPEDDELKDGIPRKNESLNEVIAAGLYAQIPTTILVEGNAIQKFVSNAKDLVDLSTAAAEEATTTATIRNIQKIACLDLSLCNVDRHLGNLLAWTDETGAIQLIPIDHALILPAGFLTGSTLAWMDWEQSRLPFTGELLEEIEKLNFDEDLRKIQRTFPHYPASNLETMRISYYLLKEGAKAGLTPFQIGLFLIRNGAEGCSYMTTLYAEAKNCVQPSADENSLPEQVFQYIANDLQNKFRAVRLVYDQAVLAVEERLKKKKLDFTMEMYAQLMS